MKEKKQAPKTKGVRLPRKRLAKLLAGSSTAATANQLARLGAGLQEIRVQSGLTQARMAALCEMQVATIRKIEAGDSGVKLGTLQNYLELLNLELTVSEAEVQ